MPAVLLFVVGSHAFLATAFVPVHSDVFVYERYAASVARAIQAGGSFSVGRDQIMRDGASRQDLPEPTSDDLLIEYPQLAVIWMATVGIGLELDPSLGANRDKYHPRYRVARRRLGGIYPRPWRGRIQRATDILSRRRWASGCSCYGTRY